MKKTIAFIGMTMLLAVSSTVGAAQITAEDSTAATITSPDGILSIEMPGEEWKEKEDSDFWFEITDGHNSIAIDHLGNGEMLPDLKMAGEENEEICQAFISTKNEVFIVTGQADSREGLADVIRTVGTLRILKYDTRTAVQKETQTDQATQSNINAVNATYYVTADELNVRADCSADSEAIGTLHKGEAVTVTGSVTEDGADTGWYQIQYQGRNGFVSSSFLSQTASVETAASTDQTAPVETAASTDQTAPVETAAGTDQNGQSGQAESGNSSGKLQCEYCGQWFSPDELREHQLSHTMDDLYGDKIQCERCGEWLSPDALRDHQLGHTMEDMNAGN